ncbi:hypothetical protein CYMTET_6954, partial [Cymbomonas tetramitiformis]
MSVVLRSVSNALRCNALARAQVAGARQFGSTAAARGGGVGPLDYEPAPSSELPEEAELTWDNGGLNKEGCLDDMAPHIPKYQALAMLSGAIGGLCGIYQLAKYNDKASTVPFAARDYPFDNLKAELG